MSQYQKYREDSEEPNKGRCQLHMNNCHKMTEKDNAPKSTEQCQSCNISICWEHSMRICLGCLQ